MNSNLNLLSPWSVHPDEMIYDDVENGEEGGNSSPEYGWSSSEFESYEEPSDSEGKNGIPRSFLRSSHKKQVCAWSVVIDECSPVYLGTGQGNVF